MRRVILFFFVCLILAPLALVGVVLSSIADRPLIDRDVDISPDNLARGQRILDNNDPRKMKPGEMKTVQLSEADLDLAVNYLVHRYAHGSARLRLEPSAAKIGVSVALPPPLAGRYLNGEAALVPAGSGLPNFTSLRVGRLPIPGWLADAVAIRVLAHFNGQEAVDVIAGAIKQLRIADGRLNVVYQWQADLPARLSGAMVPAADLDRLLVYQRRLIEIGGKAKKGVSLAELLQPLLRLAGERSVNGEAVAENRAALAVLTFYVNHKGLDAIVPGAEKWPQAVQRTVKLGGRDDFPKHFMISAALAATTDTPLADAIGLYKEVKDSRGGSGFSFNDIAADRAGVRMGEMAVASPAAALYLQRRAAGGLREADFMPATEDLPEFMPEPEFKRRFGGVGEPKYVLMMADIENRIAALPLYRR